jgi:hypothetical protein
MYLSQDFWRGPVYLARTVSDLRLNCRLRDPARAGEIWSGFSFPVDAWSGFSFPGDEKKPPASFPHHHRPVFQPSPPNEIQPKKAPASSKMTGKSLSVTDDENELLQMVAIQSLSAKKKKKTKNQNKTKRRK